MENSIVSTLPVIPIKRSVLFPGVMLPITVGRSRSVAALDAALKTEEILSTIGFMLCPS